MNDLFPQIPLIELCEPTRGIRYGILKVGTFIPDGIPVIRGGDIRGGVVTYDEKKKVSREISEKFSRTILQGGEIVINLIAEAGHSAIVPEEFQGFNVSRDVAVIPIIETVSKKYIDYYLRSPSVVWWFHQRLQGSVTQKINLETLREVPVSLPPLGEQKAIANILGTLDEKIELNKKTNETLEGIAKALFKSWFVDFDPARAKAEGRPTGLPDEVSELFPDSFEESELGEIPSGWSWQSLGDLTTLDKGVSYKGAFLSENEGVPMVNLGCFAGAGKFREEKMKFYMGDYKDRHLASSGDIFVANTDMTQNRIILGSPVLMPRWKGHEKYLFSHHVFALRLSAETSVWSGFIYHSLLRPEFRQIASGYATGTTVLALPKDGILEFTIPKAPIQLIHSFNSVFQPIAERIESAFEINRTLNDLRDALLPRLISGELRVPDAEKMLEEVGI